MTWPTILNGRNNRECFQNCSPYPGSNQRSLAFVVNAYVEDNSATYGRFQAVLDPSRRGQDRSPNKMSLNLGQVAYRVRVWPKRPLLAKEFNDALVRGPSQFGAGDATPQKRKRRKGK